jgi:hypothetical protein
MKHARLSASGSKRWIECPGSVAAEQAVGKQPSSIFGMQGTAAHHLADYCLNLGEGALATDFIGSRVYVKDDEKTVMIPQRIAEGGKLEERLVAEGYSRFDVVDEEGNGDTSQLAAWAVNMFVDYVRESYEKLADVGAALVTEVYMDLSWWHPLMGGTADANFMGMDGYIKLYDLKFGSGVRVEVRGNTQLRIYARGILELNPAAYGVDMWIVQPRMDHEDGPIRHIRYERDELMEFEREVGERAAATQMPDAELKAGDHCLFCEAKHACPEFRRHTQQLASMDFDDQPDVVQAPTDLEDLARLAEWLPMLDALNGAVHGAIARELMQGREVRGFKVVRGKTNRKYGRPSDHEDGLWEKGDPVPEEEIVRLLKSEALLSEAEMYEPRKLLSLAKMEKLGRDAKVAIKQITFKPEGPLTVALESDPREAVAVEPPSFPEDGDVMELPKP